MVDIAFPLDSLLEADVKIDGGLGAPASLAPGQLYIDEAARLLYTAAPGGVRATPLEVEGAPAPKHDPDLILIKDAMGTRWGKLDAGGGGFAFDARPYRVPGLAPTAIGTATEAAGAVDLGAPARLDRLRVYVLAGSGSITLGLYDFDDLVTPLWTSTRAIAAPGAQVFITGLDLPAGRYLSVVQGTGVTLETIEGFMPWSSQIEQHAASMQFV